MAKASSLMTIDDLQKECKRESECGSIREAGIEKDQGGNFDPINEKAFTLQR